MCQAIQAPEHAYLNCRAADWQCERGFKRVGNTCQAVQVPESSLNAST
jgi:hypothetical protein